MRTVSFSSPIVPAGLERVVVIAAGGFHNEALLQTVPPLTNTRSEAGRLRVDLNLPAGWLYQLEATRDFATWIEVPDRYTEFDEALREQLEVARALCRASPRWSVGCAPPGRAAHH